MLCNVICNILHKWCNLNNLKLLFQHRLKYKVEKNSVGSNKLQVCIMSLNYKIYLSVVTERERENI